MKTKWILYSVFLLLLVNSWNVLFAHCDTMDGPVIADAGKAIEQNNVNYILKWVQPVDENEIRDAFDLAMKVRVLSSEAQQLSDRYLFETLVRVHRSGEGVPYKSVR